MKSWVYRHRGREGKKECVLCGDECESVSHTLWDCSAYTSIRAQFLQKLKAILGGSYARFEAMSSLDKSSFVLENETVLTTAVTGAKPRAAKSPSVTGYCSVYMN